MHCDLELSRSTYMRRGLVGVLRNEVYSKAPKIPSLSRIKFGMKGGGLLTPPTHGTNPSHSHSQSHTQPGFNRHRPRLSARMGMGIEGLEGGLG